MKRSISEIISFRALKHIIYIPKTIKLIKNWPVFLLNYLGIKNTNETYLFRNGLKIKTNESIDTATIFVLIIKEDYGDFEKEKTMIDIGTNIGTFTLYAAKKTNATIYSYEPMPKTFKTLSENIKINNFGKRIKAYNLGVAAKKGRRTLFIDSGSPFNSMYSENKKSKSISIDCTTLDDLFAKNKIKSCDLLKMDCEGAEYEIIYNAKEETLSRIKKIRMEYHHNSDEKGYDIKSLVDYLAKKGFVVEKLREDSKIAGICWLRR